MLTDVSWDCVYVIDGSGDPERQAMRCSVCDSIVYSVTEAFTHVDLHRLAANPQLIDKLEARLKSDDLVE